MTRDQGARARYRARRDAAARVIVTEHDQPRFKACLDMIGRTGGDEAQLRYSADEQPVLWIAAARWGDHWEVGAALNPLRALYRLLDQVIDGGTCQHCHKPTGFSPDLDALPLDALICWYQYDPELATIRGGCEGDRT